MKKYTYSVIGIYGEKSGPFTIRKAVQVARKAEENVVGRIPKFTEIEKNDRFGRHIETRNWFDWADHDTKG